MTLTVGRITLDTRQFPQSISGRNISGRAHAPNRAADVAHGTVRELYAMVGQTVPVTWTAAGWKDGFYRLDGVDAESSDAAIIDWTLDLVRVGHHTDIQWASRRSGGGLANDHTLTAELWHAPPAGADGYETGATEPSVVTRAGVLPVDVYRNVPDVAPQWTISPAFFYDAAVQVTASGTVLAGTDQDQDLDGIWQMSNGLMRVSQRTGGLTVEHHVGGWHAKDYDVQQDASNVVWEAATVLRNTAQVCVVRLQSAPGSGVGRTLLDLELKRGARHVSCFMQRHAAATLKVQRTVAEAATQIAGGLRATDNDGNGDRYVLASTKTHNVGTTQGSISKTAVTQFDFAVGVEADGTAAQPGDTAPDIINQYLDGTDTVDVPARR